MKFVLVILFALSFKGFSQLNVSEFGLNKTWTIVEWEKYTKQELIENKCKLLITDNRIFVDARCNTIIGAIKKCTKDSITFSHFSMTMMCCKQTELELNIVHDIQLTRTYSINENEIIFVLEDKKIIKAVAELKQ